MEIESAGRAVGGENSTLNDDEGWRKGGRDGSLDEGWRERVWGRDIIIIAEREEIKSEGREGSGGWESR